MNGKRTMDRRRAKRDRICRILMCAFVFVLFAGMITQITMLARITGQKKQIQTIEKQVRDLSANADNLKLCLNQFKNLDRVGARAGQLGMELPKETQIRVVNLPAIENTSTQSVENIGAEEIIN